MGAGLVFILVPGNPGLIDGNKYVCIKCLETVMDYIEDINCGL